MSHERKNATTMDPTFEEMRKTQEHYMFTQYPATMQARNVKCKEGFVLELEMDILQNSNDKWTLFTCSPEPKNKNLIGTPGVVDYGTRYTQIIKTDLSLTWVIQHNSFDFSMMDRPDALMTSYRWTGNGKYLYLYPRTYTGPCGGGVNSGQLQNNINDLYRINLETGFFEIVLHGKQYGALGLSPDDQFLVYSQQDEQNIIHIKSMESGKDRTIQLGENIVAAGPFVWKPDGTKIVFAIAYGKKSDVYWDDISGTSIIALTTRNMHAQTILTKDSRLLIPSSWGCESRDWVDFNTICLGSISSGDNFTVNITSGSVKAIPSPTLEPTFTLTPTP